MKNERTRALLALLCSAGTPLACSGGGAVNIGNTNAVGSQLSDYAATWDGYAEAYTFMPDGSDRVRLTIDAQRPGDARGRRHRALAAAHRSERRLSARRGQPGSRTASDSGSGGGVLYPSTPPRSRRIGFRSGSKPNDYYGAWCALQTPYYVLTGYMTVAAPDGG